MLKKQAMLILFFLTLFVFVFTSVSFATEYLFDEGLNNTYKTALDLTFPKDAAYVYGVLTGGAHTADYYRLKVNDFKTQAKITLLVPVKNKDFTPTFIFGDPRSSKMIGDIPFSYPQGLGGRSYEWEKEQDFEDTHVGEKFSEGPSVIRNLSPGTYTLTVYNPTGEGGRYAISISTPKSKDKIENLFSFIFAFIRIKLRLY